MKREKFFLITETINFLAPEILAKQAFTHLKLTRIIRHTLYPSHTRHTEPHAKSHALTDLRRQLIYGRCCCMKVLYTPRGEGRWGSAKNLKYLGAKATKTEIYSWNMFKNIKSII